MPRGNPSALYALTPIVLLFFIIFPRLFLIPKRLPSLYLFSTYLLFL